MNLGMLGAGVVMGLAAIGSAFGIGIAGQGAIGAWKRCYVNNKPAPFILTVFAGAPLTQTIYGFLLTRSILESAVFTRTRCCRRTRDGRICRRSGTGGSSRFGCARGNGQRLCELYHGRRSLRNRRSLCHGLRYRFLPISVLSKSAHDEKSLPRRKR